MKKLLGTFKNIWAIDELKNKILVTLALVFAYRIGAQITLPGIDPLAIEAAQKSGTNNGSFFHSSYFSKLTEDKQHTAVLFSLVGNVISVHKLE